MHEIPGHTAIMQPSHVSTLYSQTAWIWRDFCAHADLLSQPARTLQDGWQGERPCCVAVFRCS